MKNLNSEVNAGVTGWNGAQPRMFVVDWLPHRIQHKLTENEAQYFQQVLQSLLDNAPAPPLPTNRGQYRVDNVSWAADRQRVVIKIGGDPQPRSICLAEVEFLLLLLRRPTPEEENDHSSDGVREVALEI